MGLWGRYLFLRVLGTADTQGRVVGNGQALTFTTGCSQPVTPIVSLGLQADGEGPASYCKGRHTCDSRAGKETNRITADVTVQKPTHSTCCAFKHHTSYKAQHCSCYLHDICGRHYDVTPRASCGGTYSLVSFVS